MSVDHFDCFRAWPISEDIIIVDCYAAALTPFMTTMRLFISHMLPQTFDLLIQIAEGNKAFPDRVRKLLLVTLHGQDIVRLSLDDRPGGLLLAVHRIERDDSTLKSQSTLATSALLESRCFYYRQTFA